MPRTIPRAENPQSTEEGGVNKPNVVTDDKQNSTINRNSPAVTTDATKPKPATETSKGSGGTTGIQKEGVK